MPNAFAATPRASKLRLIYLFALLTAVLALGGYGYHLYALFQEARAYSPQPQIERLIKDLRAFHSQTRHFPASFVEINERLWHTQPPPTYGTNGRTAHTRNYEYRYTRVNADTCAFWALPTGPRRHYAAAHFVVVAPSWLRVWQGKALSDEMMERLPEIPAQRELAEMGLDEKTVRN
jgi:hypothetical protein